MLEATAVDMNDLAIAVDGDVAIVTFNGDFTGQLQGHTAVRDRHSSIVLVQVAGDWKTVHEHFSPIAPVARP
jgi:ketosteroid isomerase-like protein